MTAILATLVESLMVRFSQAGFDVPQSMTQKERESFVFHTLEGAAILQSHKLERILGSAGAVVERWERGDLAAAVRDLSNVLQEDSGHRAREALRQKVLIVCQGGLVQEVFGLADDAYDVCDCDAFEDRDSREAEQYFDGLSDAMRNYLRTTGWNKELPMSRRDTRSKL
jgi:hypothetical protein